MISKWLWTLRAVLRRLWVRVAAFAALAIMAAAIAPELTMLIPPERVGSLGGEALDDVLSILASSMLAVTTFSLSIAVNAFSAAAQSATPRSIALLQEDPTTQTTLATFLGAFVFSIVGIIGVHAGYYDDGAGVVLFVFTIFVVAIVVFALLRWISYLPEFGRMNNTLDRVEQAATGALTMRLEAPWMGGRPYDAAPPEGAEALCSVTTGYVEHVDMEALQTCAEAAGGQLYLTALAGDFIHKGAALCFCLGPAPKPDALRAAFTLSATRSFEQDPRYGMVVLAEIASRALSPGINDPGTATAVIGRQVAVLSEWEQREGPNVHFDAVHVPAIRPRDMLNDAFRPIARDGCGNYDVLIRLLAALDALNHSAPEVFGEGVRDLLSEIDDRIEATNGLSAPERDLLQERRAAMV